LTARSQVDAAHFDVLKQMAEKGVCGVVLLRADW
jgi:hypothetical protein